MTAIAKGAASPAEGAVIGGNSLGDVRDEDGLWRRPRNGGCPVSIS